MAVAASLPPACLGISMAVKTAGVPALGAIQSLVAVGAAVQFELRPVLAATVPILLVVELLALRRLPAAHSATVQAIGDAVAVLPPSSDGPRRDAFGSVWAARLPAAFGGFPVAAFLLIVGGRPRTPGPCRYCT